MSAQANLAGLIYSSNDKWNEEIPFIPVPVHTVPIKQDYILYAKWEHCPKYQSLLAKHLNESAEVQRIYTEYADLLSYLSDKSGLNTTKLPEVAQIYKTLFIERCHNKTLPDWADKVMQPMEYISSIHYKTFADTPQMARLKCGFLLKAIIERFYKKSQSTLTPDRSLWFYSGHEHTIVNMLNGLGLLEVFAMISEFNTKQFEFNE